MLVQSLQETSGLSFLFITHDLAVVRTIAHRVAVMYLGNIVEQGSVQEIFSNPFHPYTEALLSASPVPDPARARSRKRIILRGEVPSARDMGSGCSFSSRCHRAMAHCSSEEPIPENVARFIEELQRVAA